MRATIRMAVVLVGMISMPITATGTIETINFNGNRYVGEARNGAPHGRGVFTWAGGGRYEGQWHDGKFHGYGMLTFADGDSYEGDFADGDFHGRGVYTWANGNRYEGDFRNDKRTGRGVFTWPNGNRYEGDFRDGKRTGRGVYTHADGSRWDGGFRDGERHGRGVFTSAEGKRWEGNYVDGQPGHGTWTQAAGSSGAPSTTADVAVSSDFCPDGHSYRGARHCGGWRKEGPHQYKYFYNRCDHPVWLTKCVSRGAAYPGGRCGNNFDVPTNTGVVGAGGGSIGIKPGTSIKYWVYTCVQTP